MHKLRSLSLLSKIKQGYPKEESACCRDQLELRNIPQKVVLGICSAHRPFVYYAGYLLAASITVES